MKSKELHSQPQNTSMRTNSEYDGNQRNVPSSDNDTERGHQQENVSASAGAETNLEDGTNSWPMKPTQCCSLDASLEQSSEDSDKIFVDALFEGTWRPTIPSVSSESIDSEISSTSLDPVTSLDDVFDDLVDSVLDEMGTFGSIPYSSLSAPTGIPMSTSGPFITPSTLRMDENQSHGYNSLYQLPNASVTGHSFGNSFQGFNFGLVRGLQNPSRGLITAMRRLCDLLSKPRSDHLDSIFVRLLNNALKEMEDAAEPQHKRPKKKVGERHTFPKRQKIRPRKTTLDGETWSQPTNFGPRSFRSKGGESTYTETVDLTSVEDNQRENCQQKQHRHVIQNGAFIALEDTMSDFMGSFFN